MVYFECHLGSFKKHTVFIYTIPHTTERFSHLTCTNDLVLAKKTVGGQVWVNKNALLQTISQIYWSDEVDATNYSPEHKHLKGILL